MCADRESKALSCDLFGSSSSYYENGKHIKEDILRLWRCAIDLHQNYRFTRNDLVLWPGRVLILESDDDPAISAPVREALKALYPQAQVYTFHKAGHTPILSKREEYMAVVKNFWKEKAGLSRETVSHS
jgi:pimeloyl-ACP methyl ester carboxylesterase